MKKNILNERSKNIGYILGYWIVFVIIPFLITRFIINNSIRSNIDIGGLINVYIVIIAPFLYFIPYLLARPKLKIDFVVWGLVVPYLFIYISLYYIATHIYNPGMH